jgi:hypothetical protein
VNERLQHKSNKYKAVLKIYHNLKGSRRATGRAGDKKGGERGETGEEVM